MTDIDVYSWVAGLGSGMLFVVIVSIVVDRIARRYKKKGH